MPRHYQPKHLKQTDRTALMEAFKYRVETKCSIRAACAKYGVKVMTLQDAFTRSKRESDGATFVSMKQNAKKVFTEDQEEHLAKYTIKIAKMFYGLSRQQFRKLAYNYAKACNSQAVPDKWDDEQMASSDWYYAFMHRHPNLGLRSPEAMSIARAVAFNRTTVNSFFEAYTSAMEKYSFTPDRIYNLDETSLSTVMKPVKVVCARGAPVASQVSRERGATMTFVGIINAAGHYLPPVFIIPRKRWSDSFMRGTLDGSKGILQSTGWMTGETFLETLQHIKEKTFSSPTNKILIIMDNAECHMTIQSIEYANDNGIVLVTLPPHTTDKLQLLDVSIYASFKSCMRTLINNFNLMNPHSHITEHMLPEFASKAWIKCCTPSNVLNGFAATGIWPINTDIFPDDAFLGAEVTERPAPPPEVIGEDEGIGSTIDSESIASTPGPSQAAVHPPPVDASTPGPSQAAVHPPPVDAVSPSSSGVAPMSVTPESVRPYPKATPRPSVRGRKRVRACILTENEEAIEMLRVKEEKKRKKQEKKTNGRAMPRQRQDVTHSSDEEDETVVRLDDSSEYSDEFAEPEEEASMFQNRQAVVGDFVLVELELEEGRNVGDKIHYVAKVMGVSETEKFSVSYLRVSGKYGINDTFYFPLIDDTGDVASDKVLGVLKEPVKGQTQRLSNILKFPCSFDRYNIH